MTNEEKIEDQYRLLGLAINWRGPDKHNQLKCIRRHLGTIKKLLEPEPESLASSVLRLTDLSNEQERENAILRNDLTNMTLNFNQTEKYAQALKADLDNKSQLYLEEAEHARVLKHDLEQAAWDATKLKRELALKEQCLRRARSRLEWIKQGLESRSVEEENRKLKRELASRSICLRRIRDQLERILEHTEP